MIPSSGPLCASIKAPKIRSTGASASLTLDTDRTGARMRSEVGGGAGYGTAWT
jgi:hypothetical protein